MDTWAVSNIWGNWVFIYDFPHLYTPEAITESLLCPMTINPGTTGKDMKIKQP